VTYLERYTLLGATGLAAVNTDTDGKPPASSKSAAAGISTIASVNSVLACRTSGNASTPPTFQSRVHEASEAKDSHAKQPTSA